MQHESFNEVDKHLEAYGVGLGESIASAYKAVRPVLSVVKSLLFFKPKWQESIAVFIASMDAEFPQ